MATDKTEQDNGEIGKEPDKTNPEDLPDYIRPFTHLFNKKKFEKLLERREWDHEINLMDCQVQFTPGWKSAEWTRR